MIRRPGYQQHLAIVTPDDVIACGPPRRPQGVMWELAQERIAVIPVPVTRQSSAEQQ